MLLSHAAPKKTGAKPPQRKRKDPQGPAEQPQARKDACSLSFGERDRCAVKWSMPLARALAAPVAAAARMRTTKTQPEPVDAPEAPKGANRAWHGFRTEEWSMAYARAAPPTAAAAPRGRTKKSKTAEVGASKAAKGALLACESLQGASSQTDQWCLLLAAPLSAARARASRSEGASVKLAARSAKK